MGCRVSQRVEEQETRNLGGSESHRGWGQDTRNVWGKSVTGGGGRPYTWVAQRKHHTEARSELTLKDELTSRTSAPSSPLKTHCETLGEAHTLSGLCHF